MIDIELLRRDPDAVRLGAAAKGTSHAVVDALVKLDGTWREQTTAVERLREEQNAATEDVAALPPAERTARIAALRALSSRIREAEEALRHLEEERVRLWKTIPNLPLPSVPVGTDASANVVRRSPERLPTADVPLRDYLDVGKALGILDTERAAVASGSRFGALVGDGVLLELALVRHALDVLTPEGFTPLLPPVLVTRAGMDAMGYLARSANEVYVTQDDLLLVGTSEQAIGAMYAGHVFAEADLPARFVAFSSCFRREAGSHGKDVHGILRVHQFDKVEMFSFCRPDASEAERAAFLASQRRLMDDLELTTRVVDLCTGDLGFAAAATTDIETWFPARHAFVETHSTSNTTDFQTRRLGTKFRGPNGRLHLVHAVNGTAYAIQRTLAALLETHQQTDGSVRIPAALRPHLGGRAALAPPS